MSRLAKKPVKVPQGVSAQIGDSFVIMKGGKGEKSIPFLRDIEVTITGEDIMVKGTSASIQSRANVGTMWALIKNAAEGVQTGFTKTLEIQGVGFRAMLEGNDLVLNLGFARPVRFTPPEGVQILVEKNLLRISGVDREKVGQAAAVIRKFKKPEPYKGKGIRYQGEVIKLKAGKKAATGGTK